MSLHEYQVQTIDLVAVVRKQFPLIDNNLSMRQKNIKRRELRKKKRDLMTLFTNTLKDVVMESYSDEHCKQS
ncbi:hypothetical protein D9M68_19130 [compost metagenome]